jgi:hypothetical protein
MKRSSDAASAPLPAQRRAYAAILSALIGSCLLVYSSAVFGLILIWRWLTAHLSPAGGLGVALAIALAVRVYLSLRDARAARRTMPSRFG